MPTELEDAPEVDVPSFDPTDDSYNHDDSAEPPEQVELPQPEPEADVAPATDPVQPAPSAASFTPEQIADLAAQAAHRVVNPPKQEPRMTDEDVDKALAVYKVSEDFLKNAGFAEPTPQQVTAFQQFADGVSRHAITVAQHLVDQKVSDAAAQFTTQVQPVIQAYHQLRMTGMVNDFYDRHADLKDYQPFVNVAAQHVLQDARYRGLPIAQRASAVAQLSRQMLKNAGVQTQQPVTTRASGRVPKMPSLSAPGRGPAVNKSTQGADEFDIYRRD
jgi:hypothetical protein